MRTTSTCLLLLTVVLAVSATDNCRAEAPSKLDALKQRYGLELAKTKNERETFLAKLNANYLRSLEHYSAGRRKESDIETMIAIRSEKVRFEEQGTVEAPDIVRVPSGLRALQMKYVDADTKHAGEIARREVPVHRQYAAKLEVLQREFVRATRLDAALAVRDEIARVRDLIPRSPSEKDKVTLLSSLREGLELHLGFDEGPGYDKRTAATVFDRSGRRNHGNLVGEAKWTPEGRVGGAIELRSKGRVLSPAGSAEWGTVCAWFKPKDTLDASTPQVGIIRTQGRIGLFVVNWARGEEGLTSGNGDDGAIDFSITPTGGAYSVCSTTTTEWRAGTWYFLCCTWDGKEQRLYVNGELEGKREQTQSHAAEQIVVGSTRFEGTVDEVMKWDRALSESEVAHLFRAVGG